MNKAFLISVFFIFILFLTSCRIDIEDFDDTTDEIDVEIIVGGDRDENGCLGSAGYTWNNTLEVCIREWEFEDIDQRNVIGMAADHLKIDDTYSNYGITVVGVNVTQCQGCYPIYDVTFINEAHSFSVNVGNWEVVESHRTYRK